MNALVWSLVVWASMVAGGGITGVVTYLWAKARERKGRK